MLEIFSQHVRAILGATWYEAFTDRLEAEGIRISMVGRGKATDKIMIERLRCSVKYEGVCLKRCDSVADARSGLRQYFRYHNCEQLHQSLCYRTPETIHYRRRSSLPVE